MDAGRSGEKNPKYFTVFEDEIKYFKIGGCKKGNYQEIMGSFFHYKILWY